MTVPALFGYDGHSTYHRSSTIPPSASDRGDISRLGGGSSGWHSHGNKGVSSAAMSALTLLVFLFFLNILQSCLQDMTTNQPAPPVVQVVPAPSAMREDGVTMMPMPVMVPMMTPPPSKRSGRKKRGDPRDLTLVRKQYVQLPVLPTPPLHGPAMLPLRHRNPIPAAAAVITQRLHGTTPAPPNQPPAVPTATEPSYIPVPLVAPGHSIENRVEEVEVDEEGAEDYQDDAPAPVPSPNIIFVRPIVPIAASFRQLAWRAINALSRPLLPLLTLWRSGRDGDGESTELCCSMLMCELERIQDGGGTFRTRLAQVIRGLTTWSCPSDVSLYHEDSDCRALISECVQRVGRHTTFSTVASLLERYVP